MRILVLSDTHAPRFWKACPPAIERLAERADIILHAGDVCTPEVLTELEQWAPVHAVLGNNDGPKVAAWGAAETLLLTLEGLRFAMIHDSGAATGRAARLRRRFPHADVVVFGHSHIPWCTQEGSQLLFNPGSPTDRRRQPHRTAGMLTISAGVLTATNIVIVD